MINLGEVCPVLNECPTEASSISKCITVQSDGVLLSLFVQELTGTLDVNIYTLTRAGEEKLIDSFPQITAPTTELLLRKQIEVHDQIRVEVITSDAAKYDIRAKGVSAGVSSVTIQGASDWEVSNSTIPNVPTLIIPSDLDDRNGLLLRNANFAGTEILRVAESEAKLLAGIYASVLPGESIQPDLRAGSEIWGESSGVDIRVEIVEIG